MRSTLPQACLLATIGLGAMSATAADVAPLFDIPRLSGIAVDGQPADWGDRGFQVGIVTSPEGQLLGAADLDAGFRLGWDDDFLYLYLTVADDAGVEHPSEGELWQRDSVELFVGSGVGVHDYYQIAASPGKDPQHAEPRHFIYDYRGPEHAEARGPVQVQMAWEAMSDGWALEVGFPWRALQIDPVEGREVSFQLYVNDTDELADWFRVTWFPSGSTSQDAAAMHRLRLAGAPSSPVQAVFLGEYENLRRTRVQVRASAQLTGATAVLWEGSRELARGILEPEGRRAETDLILPMPPRDRPYDTLRCTIDGQEIGTVDLPDPAERRARALMDIQVGVRPSVFAGGVFPATEVTRPLWVEELIGPYHIETRYFDGSYNEVTVPAEPGRYGAVIDLIPEQGRRVRRYRTLYRLERDVPWWQHQVVKEVELPAALGISRQAVAEEGSLMEHLKWRFTEGFRWDSGGAAVLAGLCEYETVGQVRPHTDVWARDRQWWVGLKRRLAGIEAGPPFECPRPIRGPGAPMLREGSLAEAGMRPEAADSIDAVLTAWAADTDEAFAACVARHGVIVLHKAYGMRDGEPMTVDTRSWMASITKLLSGTLMMMLVDQGLVDLDARVDEYLPALRDIDVPRDLTIRHLYTHTNGMWGHWGDDMHDFDEVMADYYPYLDVGERFEYNGAGYSMGGKVIEILTGESIPRFYHRHLLDPLGCTNTRVTGTSGDADSIPLDMARIAQMLLNKGAYGDLRFFDEETFQKMLPVRLTAVLSPETETQRGIGCVWHDQEGLGEGTFGHGAASSATLRIDPTNDLVIAMTRNSAGTNFGTHYPQFLQTIVDGIAD